jgi:AraC-like DNA-binding protein
MNKIDKLLENFPKMEDGTYLSRLDGVLFFQKTEYVPVRPLVYPPGIAIVLQGHKIAYLGKQKFRYDANHYLVASVTMPCNCETFASQEEPVRGLYIDIDMGQLRELIGQMDLQLNTDNNFKKTLPCGIGPATMDKDMRDAVLRLLKCLQSETETQILGPGLVREILYRVLCGNRAPILYSLAMHSGTFSQVARALKMIQNNYAGKLDVEQLAGMAHLSVSAFHRAFKDITSDSPMQYLKKIRLTKAKELMIQENLKAYIAADKVGYESSSQFSREFKRYFGQSPAEMMRELRIS